MKQGPAQRRVPGSTAADSYMVPRLTDIPGLTHDESRRFAEWLAASYASDPLEVARWSDRELARCADLNREFGAQAVRRQFIYDSQAAAAHAARTVWTRPTHDELRRRRYPWLFTVLTTWLSIISMCAMTASRTRRPRVRHTITTWPRGRFTTVIKGPVRTVHAAITSTGTKWQWCPQVGAYLVARAKADDVLAAIEQAGHIVQYEMPGWS